MDPMVDHLYVVPFGCGVEMIDNGSSLREKMRKEGEENGNSRVFEWRMSGND